MSSVNAIRETNLPFWDNFSMVTGLSAILIRLFASIILISIPLSSPIPRSEIGLESGIDIRIIDANNRIRMADKPVTIEKSSQYGRFVSLIAETDDNEVSLKGFKYPVTDYSFDRFTSLGISNEIIDDHAVIDIHRGKFIIIESKD